MSEKEPDYQAQKEREAACVHACREIPTKVLSIPGYSIKAELDTLDAQIEARLRADATAHELHGELLACRALLAETLEDMAGLPSRPGSWLTRTRELVARLEAL